MEVFAATKNAGKLRELQAIFAPHGWTVRPYEGFADVDETGTTYEENAALKARALHAQLRAADVEAAVMGDDSGLEVAVLGNRPGPLSARYGPLGASWTERRSLLVSEVDAAGAGRDARFVCVLHYIDHGGTETAVTGTVEGRIAASERGDGGFSYDAIFEYPPLGATFAELSAQQKNAVSHRAAAARALVEAIG